MKILTGIVTWILVAFFSLWAQEFVESSGKTLSTEHIEFKEPPHFRVVSRDSINGKPLYEYFLYVKAKLNGVYDINGGMYEETFNVGKIPVWGTEEEKRFWMDMHQSQIRFRGQSETAHGTYTAYLEGDFWGGNKHFRLRHLWFEYTFANLGKNWKFTGHIGQDWSFFGDKDIWPNVFEWDGPSSGVWRREPELRFWFERNENLRLEFGAANPGAELYFPDQGMSVARNLNPAKQPLPDFIGAVNKKFGFGHLRFTAIYRHLTFRENENLTSLPGYGASFSGYIRTSSQRENPIQFQVVAGSGIATYLVSFSGMNWDAAPDSSGTMQTIPTIGGWVSYEHWFSKKWHANLVLGYSLFQAKELAHFSIPGTDYYVVYSQSQAEMKYLLVNFMWNPIPSVAIGAEWNYGVRKDRHEGLIISFPASQYSVIEKSRAANRISFGTFFNF